MSYLLSKSNLLCSILVQIVFLTSCTEEHSSSQKDANINPNCPFLEENTDKLLMGLNNSISLFGGEHDSMHFNVLSNSLDFCNLKFGLGRETFQALLEPQFENVLETNIFKDDENCIILKSNDEKLVFPYVQLQYHEAVNTYINSIPVLVAYCVRADLAVVYERTYCDVELHFGVSGYTYFDNTYFDGIDAFLLWDRESESLWWPLSDLGVSGRFNNHQLIKANSDYWEILPWGTIVKNYPDAKYLKIQNQYPPSKNFKVNIKEDC